MSDDYMSEADNEVDGGYFADLEYSYQQKEIRRQEDKENKAKKEENRKQQLLRQNKCIENLKIKINKLKQQLAEKDKEIERLKERLSVFDNFKDNYGYTNYDDSEILEDLQSRAFQAEDDTRVVNELLQFFNIFDENELVDKVKGPQTQLAIQELEKVKDWLNEPFDEDGCFKNGGDLIGFVDQQINDLRGEKDVED